MTIKRVCSDMLREELKHPIKSSRQAWSIIEKLAICFVSVSDEVHQIGVELYGNGNPGGMKVALKEIEVKANLLQDEISSIRNDLSEIRSFIQNNNSEKNTAQLDKKKDTFDSILKWFVDKVLPSLVIGLIIGIGNLLLFVSFLFYAYSNNLLVLP